MEKIILTPKETNELFGKLFNYADFNSDSLEEDMMSALKLEKIPVNNFKIALASIEKAQEAYLKSREMSPKESAAVRRWIELCDNEKDLLGIFREIGGISYLKTEMFLVIRKIAQNIIGK